MHFDLGVGFNLVVWVWLLCACLRALVGGFLIWFVLLVGAVVAGVSSVIVFAWFRCFAGYFLAYSLCLGFACASCLVICCLGCDCCVFGCWVGLFVAFQ